MNIVIYARYSSHRQTEQSIEGQLETCHAYAKENDMVVVGEYIDRAQTGTNAKRSEFQRMIADSAKHQFEAVLVYQLDRFARNRYDSATYKNRLKKNGVRVISAKENISDDPSGILVESVLEGMAEYYSAELSQKIHRGMNINAEKHLSNGSVPSLGYCVDKNKQYQIDPETAPIVREIFEMYGSGKTVTEINQYLNDKQLKTSHGNAFNKNSLHRLLRNKRYIGYYIFGTEETPDAMPRIIDDELFERVQTILDKNKKAPARARAKEEYLLTTKLFCGYCREMMVGYSGTSKTGTMYYYYICKNARKKKCAKKIVNKKAIEDRVVTECRKLLTDDNILKIAKEVAAVCRSDTDGLIIQHLKTSIKEKKAAIENLWNALEHGQAAEMITARIEERTKEKEALEAQLAEEMNKEITLTEPQVTAFLLMLKKGSLDNEKNRKGLVNVFLRAVYLWDDKMTLILNGSKAPIKLEDIPLDEIQANIGIPEGSALNASCPPNPLISFDTIEATLKKVASLFLWLFYWLFCMLPF